MKKRKFNGIIMMAMVDFTVGIQGLRNKLGNLVFTVGRSGAVVRRLVSPHNPQTADQITVRALLKQFTQAWRSLSAANIIAWNDQAKLYTLKNIFGKPYHTTGHKLFVSWNLEAALDGNITQIDTPFSPTMSTIVQISAMNFDSSVSPTVATVTTDQVVPADATCIIECTDQLSAGVSNAKGKFHIIKRLASGTTAGTHSIKAEYEAKFGTMLSGRKVFIKAYTTNNDTDKHVVKSVAADELSGKVK